MSVFRTGQPALYQGVEYPSLTALRRACGLRQREVPPLIESGAVVLLPPPAPAGASSVGPAADAARIRRLAARARTDEDRLALLRALWLFRARYGRSGWEERPDD